jgi:hypothetical protein
MELAHWFEVDQEFPSSKAELIVDLLIENDIHSVRDLSRFRGAVSNIFMNNDIILEEWEAMTFFSALDALEKTILVTVNNFLFSDFCCLLSFYVAVLA